MQGRSTTATLSEGVPVRGRAWPETRQCRLVLSAIFFSKRVTLALYDTPLNNTPTPSHRHTISQLSLRHTGLRMPQRPSVSVQCELNWPIGRYLVTCYKGFRLDVYVVS